MKTLRINGRDVKPHKATVSPNLGARTVLTDSHWEYVSLWLRRAKKSNALFYCKDKIKKIRTYKKGIDGEQKIEEQNK